MLKQLFTIGVLMVGVALGGCIVVVDDKNKRRNNDGGGSASAASTDDSSGGYDDGAGSSTTSSGGGGGGNDGAGNSGGGAPRYYVYGYREAYRNLPEMGETKDYFRVHGNLGQIDRGYYYGDWNCGAQGMVKEGAGQGESVIDGHLEIKGNNWILRGCTVTGDVKIRGNDNDLTGLEVLGDYDVRGTGNKTSR